MNANDYPALKNLHKMLKNYVDVMTIDGVYIGDSYGLETYEKLDRFIEMEKKSHLFSKIEENYEKQERKE
jgi:hypothetical protein